jgi:hypothetical protein
MALSWSTTQMTHLLSPASSMLSLLMSTMLALRRSDSNTSPWRVLNSCATIVVFSFLLPSQMSCATR